MTNRDYEKDIENLKLVIDITREELDANNELMERMERLLTATANALHGGYAPPDCLHSWHDLPELVEKLRKERDEARAAKENTNG